jgi:maleate cis-trans isomerase
VVARGRDYEDVVVKDIEGAAGVPATTGVRAVREALHHVGARRVAIASPYPERHDQAMSTYLSGDGFEIVRAEGLNVPFKKLHSVSPAEIRSFASGVLARAKGCDSLFLPCPQWQAAQVVDDLERENGIPVVAYAHASFFVAFKALGLKDPIHGHGRLLMSLAED